MNRERRKRLEEIKEKIAPLLCELEEISDEEETAYDNLPESIQNSERGENMYDAALAIQEIYDCLESAETGIDELIY